MRKILAFLWSLVFLPAFAQNPNHLPNALVLWPMPGAYSDGHPMPASDVAYVTIAWSVPGTNLAGTIRTGIVPTQLVIPTPCGVYNFSGSYTTTATAHVPNMTSNVATATYNSGVTCSGLIPQPPHIKGI